MSRQFFSVSHQTKESRKIISSTKLTTCGSSGKSRFGFFTVLVDSLRAGILAALDFPARGGSPIPLMGVVGVVVSAFLFTPFLT